MVKRSQFDWDGKYCPDCGGKCVKRLIKWPHPFEAYVCGDCEMDWFPSELDILPQKPVAVGINKKGELKFRVLRDLTRDYTPPKLRKNNEA